MYTKLIIIVVITVCVVAGGLYVYSLRMQQVADEPETISDVVAVPTPSSQGTVITVWAWNIAAKALHELVPEFNRQYPDVRVQVVEIPHDEANAKFKIAVSTGVDFPDVWDTEGTVTSDYIKSGALADITERATKYRNDFVEYKWGEVTDNGRIYALPWDTAPVGLFYRRDIFSAAGVDPEKIITWDDYIEAGKKVTKDVNGDGKPDQYMTLLSRKVDVGETFQIILSQFGGSIVDESGAFAFNSPAGIQTVQLMRRMMDAGIGADIGWWSAEMFDGIRSGQIASLVQGVWMGGQIKEAAPLTAGKWGVTSLPAVTQNGVRTAVRGGSNLAITSKSKNQDAAWKFIEFALARKESQLQMYKNWGIFPALKAAYQDPVFKEPQPFFNGQRTSELFIQVQNQLPLTFHYGPRFIETNQIISSEVILAINGTKSAQQALTDAQRRIENLVGPQE
jgi:lactose/L-arabinose transport system substrate-binding protein